MSNETDKMSIAKELMRETEGATISIAYNSWSASILPQVSGKQKNERRNKI